VNDSWIRDRVNGLTKETSPREEWAPRPARAAHGAPARQTAQSGPDQGGDVQQTLHVLALAQQTAEEHVASARAEANKIHADARATAEQIVREAQAQADAVRREADKALAEARAAEAQIVDDVRAHANAARRDGDKIVADARARAAETAEEAQAHADGLAAQARQRHQEMVGNLEVRRETLQQQIEALQEFDRNYRDRLLTFVQAHLRALWVEEPHVDAEIEPRGGTD
jgi:cell division septum initiation protein DivIVA